MMKQLAKKLERTLYSVSQYFDGGKDNHHIMTVPKKAV